MPRLALVGGRAPHVLGEHEHDEREAEPREQAGRADVQRAVAPRRQPARRAEQVERRREQRQRRGGEAEPARGAAVAEAGEQQGEQRRPGEGAQRLERARRATERVLGRVRDGGSPERGGEAGERCWPGAAVGQKRERRERGAECRGAAVGEGGGFAPVVQRGLAFMAIPDGPSQERPSQERPSPGALTEQHHAHGGDDDQQVEE